MPRTGITMATVTLATSTTMADAASRRPRPVLRRAVPAPTGTSSEPADAANSGSDQLNAALFKLLAWLSPSFPVGAFSYSHGLEWAVEDGTITDAATLAAWLGDVLRHGAGGVDAVLFAHTWRTAASSNDTTLDDVAELAAAFQPSKERHLEATAQGRAFLSTVAATWPNARLETLAARLAERPVAYPVAVAVAAAAHEVPLADALAAYLQAFAANLVSAAVRAVPLGQTDGQRVIAALAPVVAEVAEAALATPLDAIGGAVFRGDIASMKHETQYTRLFRS